MNKWMSAKLLAGAATVASLAVQSSSLAQCAPQWSDEFGYPTGGFSASIMHNDGSGETLFVGCELSLEGSTVGHVAKRQGDRWVSLGNGLTRVPGDQVQQGVLDSIQLAPYVNDFVQFDPDGPGPLGTQLIVAGTFNAVENGTVITPGIAAWNGSSWTAMSNGLRPQLRAPRNVNYSPVEVYALAVFDDTCGLGGAPAAPKLFCAGRFAVADSDANLYFGIAVWDGSSWQPVGLDGIPPIANPDSKIGTDLIVFDGGTGPALYLCGDFEGLLFTEGTRFVAKWTGCAWESAAGGINTGGNAFRFASLDRDGPGGVPPTLYTVGNGNILSRMDGMVWTGLTMPLRQDGFVGSGPDMLAFDDGSGAGHCLYIATSVRDGAPHRMMRYDGTSFSFIGDPVVMERCGGAARCGGFQHIGHFNDNGIDRMFVTGTFRGTPTLPLATRLMWDGFNWAPMGKFGIPTFIASDQFNENETHGAGGIAKIDTYDVDGNGPAPKSLIALGGFNRFGAGTTVFHSSAFRTGETWTPFTSNEITSFQDNGGTFVSFYFNDHTAAGDSIYAAAVVQLPDTVIIGRTLHYAEVYKVVDSAWTRLGPPLTFSRNNLTDPVPISSLFMADFGSGRRLYALGDFEVVNGSPATGLAMWDGSSWTPAGSPPDPHTRSIFTVQDGSSEALFAIVSFVTNPLRKWNGSAWIDVNAGIDMPAEPVFGDINVFLKVFSLNGVVHAWKDARYEWYGPNSGIPGDVFYDPGTLYRWNNGSWTSIGSPLIEPGFIANTIGVTRYQNRDRLYLSGYQNHIPSNTLFGGVYVEDGQRIFSHDGDAFTELTSSMGRISGVNKVVTFRDVFASQDPAGGESLWFLGSHGVDGVFTANPDESTDFPGFIASLQSFGIARWYCNAPPCPADFNLSGSVTVQDIFDFLAAWFAGNTSADFNHVAGVTVQDIFDFLAAWFAGCN